jgi:PEP-CTERM motif
MTHWKLTGVLVVLGVIGLSGAARAVPFDFSTLNGGVEGFLPGQASSATVAGVAVNAFQGSGSAAPLWVRNIPNDHGLGVCSEGGTACGTSGEINELSSLTNREAIVLTLPSGFTWTSLWVSSLDPNGSNGGEKGVVYWSDTTAFTAATPHFGFGNGDFGPGVVEGNILALGAASSFDNTAKYVVFIDNPTNCSGGTCDNDYLVWKGDLSPVATTPEPGTLLLLGSGLAGIAVWGRRPWLTRRV